MSETPSRSPDPARTTALSVRAELVLLGLIGLAFALICILLVGSGAPLGHDEAVYALKARTLAEGTSSAHFWNASRAPGLPMILALVARSTDVSMRLGVVVFGGLAILLTWLVGRTIFDQRVGLIAATGMALSPVVIASASSVWPDLPGATVGLAALAVMVFAVRGDRVNWWILAAAPLSVGATLVRFGAPIPIGIGAIAIAVWRWRLVRNAIPQVLVLGVLTVVPVAAILATPTVLGLPMSPLHAISSQDKSRSFPFYRGLVDYAKVGDFLLLTPAGVALLVGLAFGVVAAIKLRRDRSAFTLSAGIAIVTVLVLVFTLHGEYRYLTPAYPWLWMAAAYGLSEAARSLRQEFVLPMVAVVAVLSVLSGIADGGLEVRHKKERFPDIRAAARLIDSVTADGECGVVTGYVPQVSWYSHCVTANYSLDGVRLTSASFPADPTLYVFVVQNGKRQPAESVLDDYLDQTIGECIVVGEPTSGPFRYVRACPVSNP